MTGGVRQHLGGRLYRRGWPTGQDGLGVLPTDHAHGACWYRSRLSIERAHALCRPYLGDLSGVFTDWTPLQDRSALYEENLDRDDPWQFGNFRAG